MACPTGPLVVKKTDPRINYNLAPGEKLMTCPYNKSHAVLVIKFSRHVNNCHRHHCKEQEQRGEPVKFAICSHDRSHHVLKELLEEHEKNCPSRIDAEDDDWGQPDEAGAAGGAPVVHKVRLPPPPELTEEHVAMIHEEDWDEGPAYPEFTKADADEKIHQLRVGGYNYIKSAEIVGKTRAEKKEFYAEDAKAIEAAEEEWMLERLEAWGDSPHRIWRLGGG